MRDCCICALHRENENIKARKELERKALKSCWIDGGMVNDVDETTVITIDAFISKEHKKRILDLLKEIETH